MKKIKITMAAALLLGFATNHQLNAACENSGTSVGNCRLETGSTSGVYMCYIEYSPKDCTGTHFDEEEPGEGG